MTTQEAAKKYLEEHIKKMGKRKYAIVNPKNLPEKELPVIYGFNNGGAPGWYSGQLLAEDGTTLGGHVCSNEAYMYHDLGILEGTRPDRHETFLKHYPNGYRMEFVPSMEVEVHEGLNEAIRRNQKRG